MAHGESIPQQLVDIATKVEKSGQDTSRQAEADKMASALVQPTSERDRLAGLEQLDAQALRDAVAAPARSSQTRARHDERPTEFDTRRRKLHRKFQRAYGARYLS
eukprot:4813867-Amphidinium_carterae.1